MRLKFCHFLFQFIFFTVELGGSNGIITESSLPSIFPGDLIVGILKKNVINKTNEALSKDLKKIPKKKRVELDIYRPLQQMDPATFADAIRKNPPQVCITNV